MKGLLFAFVISFSFSTAYAAAISSNNENSVEVVCSKLGHCSLVTKSCNAQSLKNLPPHTELDPEVYKNSKHSIHWQEYSKDMFAKAKDAKQLIIIFSKSNSCPWSMKMEQDTFNNPAVAQIINDHFYPVMLDFDTNQDISAQYKIVDLPTIIIMDSNDKAVKTYSGYQSPEKLKSHLQQISEQYKSNI